MAIKLVVTIPFASYSVGDEITEATAVDATLGGYPSHVVKVAVEDPAPEPAPAPAPMAKSSSKD